MSLSPFKKFPILRLLIPLIAGIVGGELFQEVTLSFILTLGFVGLAAMVALRLWASNPTRRMVYRKWNFLPLFVLVMACGWGLRYNQRPTEINLNHINGKTVCARINSITMGENSMTMEVQLKGDNAPAKIQLTTRECDYTLRAGNLISFTANIKRITNANHEDDTDFSLLLLRKGLIYRQHEDIELITKCGHESTLQTRATNIRHHISRAILNSGLSTDSKNFMLSLLLGDRHFINADTRQAYSVAGVAHILALSGLHIGILVVLLWWLLRPLDYVNLRKLRLAITILLIFAYAFFTGMSPSVVRASIMMSFTFIAYILYRKNTPLNALLVAALIILCGSPLTLFDAGFQLSFITVGTLLITSPLYFSKTTNPILGYIKTTCITSAVAMIATLMLSAYYFHNIAWLSVLSNLLILPVFPLFMILGVLIILLATLQIDIALLDTIANLFTQYFNTVTNTIGALPFSHAANVYVTGWDLACYYIGMALVLTAILRKQWRYAGVAVGVALLGITGHIITLAGVPRHGIVLFNSYSDAAVCYYHNDTCTIWEPEHNINAKKFQIAHAGFLARHGIDSLRIVGADTLQLQHMRFCPPRAEIKGKTFLLAGNYRWITATAEQRPAINYCIIGNKFHGSIPDIERLYQVQHYIIAGNVYEITRFQLQHQLDSLQLKYTVLNDGAMQISLP